MKHRSSNSKVITIHDICIEELLAKQNELCQDCNSIALREEIADKLKREFPSIRHLLYETSIHTPSWSPGIYFRWDNITDKDADKFLDFFHTLYEGEELEELEDFYKKALKFM